MGNAKLAKSTGNTAYLSDVIERDIHPLALRYWFLTAHYRQPSNFSWEAVAAAQKAYVRLYQKYQEVKDIAAERLSSKMTSKYIGKLNDDLDTPGAIATLWDELNSEQLTDGEIKAFLQIADSTLGLGFTHSDDLLRKLSSSPTPVSAEAAPEEIQELFKKREEARKNKDWSSADTLRKEILERGYVIEDTSSGSQLLKK